MYGFVCLCMFVRMGVCVRVRVCGVANSMMHVIERAKHRLGLIQLAANVPSSL